MEMTPITLDEKTLEKIQQVVKVEDKSAMIQFVTDALNSYMHLGQMAANGAQFLARDGDDGEPRRMRFPFETQPSEAAE